MISSFSSLAGKRNCASFFANKHKHASHHADEPKLYTNSSTYDYDYDYINDPDNVADIPSARYTASPEVETEKLHTKQLYGKHSPKNHSSKNQHHTSMNCLQNLIRRSNSESNLSILSLVSC